MQMEDVSTGIPCLHSSLFKVLLLVIFQVDVRVNQYGTRLGKSLIVYYPAVIIIKKSRGHNNPPRSEPNETPRSGSGQNEWTYNTRAQVQV